MNKYDPYVHAHELGIDVYFRPMERWRSLWFPDQRVLVLRQNMSVAVETSVLTDAIAHVESGSLEKVPTTTRDTVLLLPSREHSDRLRA